MRDRDPAGRPRNARRRDALGRPLPRDARDTSDASDAGAGVGDSEERIPDDLSLPPQETVRLADQLLRDGRPFHAHEVLEAAWKTGPADERDLWQGLAQIAVGLTHAHRGNARGAVTLLRRGAQRVREFPRPDRYGMAAERMTATALTLADDIERDGLASISPAALRPALLSG
jgi:hypothetical protein